MASRVTGTRTTSATTHGARRSPGHQPQGDQRHGHHQHREDAVVQHDAADEPDQGRAGVGPAEVEQQPHAVRRSDHASGQRPPHRTARITPHLQPGDPLGLQHAGPVGRDQPAREAVVERQRLAGQVEREQGVRVVGEVAGQGADPFAAVLLERLDEHLAAGGCVDQVEQVAHRYAGPGRARAPALDAGDRQRGGGLRHRAQVGEAQPRLRGRRTPPSAGTPRWWRR